MDKQTSHQPNKTSLYTKYFGEDVTEDIVIQYNEDSNLFEWHIPAEFDTSEMPKALVNGRFTGPNEAFKAMENFLETKNEERKKERRKELDKANKAKVKEDNAKALSQ